MKKQASKHQKQAATMDWFPIAGSFCFTNIYPHIWQKNDDGMSCPYVNIPDTIVLHDGVPMAWYFTSTRGDILKKNQSNLKISTIIKAFTRGGGGKRSEIVACVVNEKTGKTDESMVVDYLTKQSLGMFLL